MEVERTWRDIKRIWRDVERTSVGMDQAELLHRHRRPPTLPLQRLEELAQDGDGSCQRDKALPSGVEKAEAKSEFEFAMVKNRIRCCPGS